jgi:hypothetical protein
MLLRDGDLVIGQPAHAWVSGQLARAWSPPPSPWEEVCLAAEQHDVGWADADLAPLLGDDGRPVPFLAVPRAEHLAIWRAAARRMLAQSRYAALLVSLHGTSLYARIDPAAYPEPLAEDIRAYARAEEALQASLAEGLDPAEVDRNRRLLLAWDRFSLALCHGSATTLEDVPAGDGASVSIRVEPRGAAAYAVAPWPFADEHVVVGCEARHLPGRFATREELAGALAAAPWVPLRWALSPG